MIMERKFKEGDKLWYKPRKEICDFVKYNQFSASERFFDVRIWRQGYGEWDCNLCDIEPYTGQDKKSESGNEQEFNNESVKDNIEKVYSEIYRNAVKDFLDLNDLLKKQTSNAINQSREFKPKKVFFKLAGREEFISSDLIATIEEMPNGNICATSLRHGYESTFGIDKEFHKWDKIKAWIKDLTP